MSQSKKTYDKEYQETLKVLAEAIQVLNEVRAERLRDDSSPFNPKLSQRNAETIIRKARKITR